MSCSSWEKGHLHLLLLEDTISLSDTLNRGSSAVVIRRHTATQQCADGGDGRRKENSFYAQQFSRSALCEMRRLPLVDGLVCTTALRLSYLLPLRGDGGASTQPASSVVETVRQRSPSCIIPVGDAHSASGGSKRVESGICIPRGRPDHGVHDNH